MADNKTLTTTVATVPSGTVLASDEVGGVDYPRGKVSLGDNGTVVDWVGGAGAVGTNTGRVTLASDDPAVALLGTIDADTGAIKTAVETLDNAISGSEMQVDVVGALPAGTNAIGKLAANSGVDIGDVDVTSIAAGDNNIGNVDIVTVNAQAAHDAAVAGTPVLISGSAQTMDDTAPPNRVSAESDATRIATSLDGAVFAHPHGPQVWSYHLDTSSAQTDTTVHASPGAGLSLYVTDIVFSSGAATAINLFFEEGASKVLGPYYLEAIAGRGMALHFQVPKKITAATALTLTTSAAIAHSVDVTGFVAPA